MKNRIAPLVLAIITGVGLLDAIQQVLHRKTIVILNNQED